ncbi:MAG: signal recognition particle protein, partial [Clostridia bacterium]|nr:signal recognition particle protein [Clostridia bacterium]
LENCFSLEDYLTQFESMKKMGGAQALVSMMPGLSGKVKDGDIDESRIERTKAIILSMTRKERNDPAIINSSRKKRIAAGIGTSVKEINQLLKQFEQTKLLMKQLKSGKRRLPF